MTAQATSNTFYADGVVREILEQSALKSGVPVQVVYVDVTDALDKGENVVPFSLRTDKRALPEGLAPGDVVRVQFRLGGYRYGKDRAYLGANLRLGNIEVSHRADEFARVQDDMRDEIEEFAEHLWQIEQNRRNNKR